MALRDMSLSVIIGAKNALSGELKRLEGDLGGVEGKLRTSAAETADFNAQWEQTINTVQMAGAALAAAGAAVTAVMGKATQMAMRQEDAEKRLGVIYGDNADQLIEYAAALQQQTRYGDEAIIETAAIGATYRNLRKDIEPAIEAALHMSEAYGMDLVQAMHMLGRASSGMVGNMRRVGIMVDANEVKARGMAAVYETIAEETQSAAFQTESASKSFDQMANAAGDVWESIGMALLPAVVDLSPRVIALAEGAQELAQTPLGESAIQWAAGLGMAAVAAGGVMMVLPSLVAGWGYVSAAATVAWAAMTGPVGLAVIGIGAVAAAIYGLVTATERAERAQMAQWESMEAGAVTSTEALKEMREHTRGIADDLRDAGDEADTMADKLEAARAAYVGEVFDERARIIEREAALEDALARQRKEHGEQSRQALEAENRLLEEQQKLKLLDLELAQEQRRIAAEGREGENLWGNEEAQAQIRAEIDAIAALKAEFAELEQRRMANARAIEDLEIASDGLATTTAGLTTETQALADAHEKASDAAESHARTERDAARDVERAADRIADAERTVEEAVEARARAIEDANRRVADAQRAYADAVVASEERVADAKDRAARSVESAEKRVARIREQLAGLDAPALTEAQRKEQRRMELMQELAEAEASVNEARVQGKQDVEKAEQDATRMVEDAARRVMDAERAKIDAVEQGNKRIEDARRRWAEATEAHAIAEEKANERIGDSLKKLTQDYERLAEAREKAGYPSGAPAAGTPQAPQTQAPPRVPTGAHAVPAQHWRAGPMPRYAPQAAGAGAGGGRIDVYLHSDGTFVLNTAKNRAGDIIGSANGQQAVLHLVRDAFARQ